MPAKNSSPIGLISIPHSGEWIPSDFRPYLTSVDEDLRADVDYQVPELIDIEALNQAGVGVMRANIHRACVDLNRPERESVLFWQENTHGNSLVLAAPSPSEVETWIRRWYEPYFTSLREKLTDLQRFRAGPIPFVDLHSMPSKPTPYHFRRNPNQSPSRPDFCLSDRDGKTCVPDFIGQFAEKLGAHYSTRMNDPYKGGYITEFVDAFSTNNIQIEVNRSIYMDEAGHILDQEKIKRLKPVLTSTLVEVFTKFSRREPSARGV